MRKLLIVPVLLFALLLGCVKAGSIAPGTNPTLAKVVQAESDVDTGVAAALTITQQVYAANLIDKATASQIASVLATVTQANAQAIALTKTLTTISATNALTLQSLESPITTALQNLVNSGLVGIKDAKTKATVTAALSTLLVTLQIIQGVQGV
jgi:hypothetical protein